MAGLPWTDDEKEIIKNLIENNLTIDHAVLVLKSRTKDAIEKKASELGLSFMPKPVIDHELYKRLCSKVEDV